MINVNENENEKIKNKKINQMIFIIKKKIDSKNNT